MTHTRKFRVETPALVSEPNPAQNFDGELVRHLRYSDTSSANWPVVIRHPPWEEKAGARKRF